MSVPETKPTKPLTSFFAFSRDKQLDVAHLPQKEKTIELGRLWRELSQVERDNYNKQHKEDVAKYEVDLENWYQANPEDRIKDKEEAERQRQKNKEKKEKDKDKEKRVGGSQTTKTEPKRNKAIDADNLLMCFTVAQLKRRRQEYSDTPIYPTNGVKRTIKSALNEMADADKELWLNFWYDLDSENQNRVRQFYQEWKELKAKE